MVILYLGSFNETLFLHFVTGVKNGEISESWGTVDESIQWASSTKEDGTGSHPPTNPQTNKSQREHKPKGNVFMLYS